MESLEEQRRNAKAALEELANKLQTFYDRQKRSNFRAFENADAFRFKVDTFAEGKSIWISCLDTCKFDDVNRAVEDATTELANCQASPSRGDGNLKRKKANVCSLTLALEGVIEAFEKVRKPYLFSAVRKYVRLRTLVDYVEEALLSDRYKGVVVYGGPGEGKSILAKHLALRYQNDGSTQFVDGVFFFNCGPQADSKGLLVQLWQELCYRSSDSGITVSHEDMPSANNEGPTLDLDSGYKVVIEQMLTNKKVLIILDDVSETSIVDKILVQGKGVKYLITTQKDGFLLSPSLLPIKIPKPDFTEARKILANHISAFPGDIPADFQVAVDEIVEKSGKNPLILANVATKMNKNGGYDRDEWRSTSKSLADLPEGDIMSASMTMAVNSFSQATKTLLFMAVICESQSVPERVFQIFFNHLSLGEFSSCSDDLENENFVHIDSKVVQRGVDQRTWSIHSTRRNFIREYWKDDVMTVVSNLSNLSRSSDGHVVCGLLMMYSWSHYGYEAAENLGIQMIPSKLDLVKPFVWLLHPHRKKPWQEESHEFAKQVILNYLREGEIHDQGMSTLLSLKEIALASCHALTTMALLANAPVLTASNNDTMRGMREVVESNGHSVPTTLALYALGRFVEKSSKPIGLWNKLVRSIRTGVKPEIKALLDRILPKLYHRPSPMEGQVYRKRKGGLRDHPLRKKAREEGKKLSKSEEKKVTPPGKSEEMNEILPTRLSF